MQRGPGIKFQESINQKNRIIELTGREIEQKEIILSD